MNQPSPNPPATELVIHPAASSPSRRSHYLSDYPYGSESSESLRESGGLYRYWQSIVRQRKAICFASLAGLIGGYAITVPIQPVYRARTSLEVVSLNQDFLNLKQASPTAPGDNSYDTSEEATQAKLLSGETLIARVTSKLDRSHSKLLLDRAARSVKVRSTPHTRVLEITVDSVDPKLAQDFANTLTQEFVAQKAEDHWAAAQNTHEWLRRELDEAKNDLRRSEDDLQRYARTSGIVLTDETTNVATEKLQQVQQALSEAATERIAKQSRFELAQSSPAGSLADVLNDTGLREAQLRINDLSREIANLKAVYNPEYSKVRRLEAELGAIHGAFLRQRDEVLERIRTDYLDAKRREDLLAVAYDNQTREVTDQGEKTVQYKILKREVESNRQLYDTMLQQMKQSSIASALRASTVRVVDRAQTPSVPVFPSFRIDAAAGLLFGLFLGVTFVLIRDQVDRTLQQPGDAQRWIDLPELGAIPNARVIGTRTVELVAWQSKQSLVAEAFRSALTSILYTGENGSRPRVLVFTSANAADGKTTVVSNLAIASAEIRLRVLVIDADLRRPRMHDQFNVRNEYGLSDILQENFSDGLLSVSVQETNIMNLHVLTAGPETQAAAHLLHSPNLPRLLQTLRKEYDMILIDTPPMMQLTDARIVGRQADAVVLVARSGHTTRDSLAAAKQRFAEDHTNVLGTMLTGWDPRRSAKLHAYPASPPPTSSYRPARDSW